MILSMWCRMRQTLIDMFRKKATGWIEWINVIETIDIKNANTINSYTN